MVNLELVCKACKHSFVLESKSTLKDEEKRCPRCESESVRQTVRSYLRNGPLLDPEWANGGGGGCRTYG